MAQRNTASSGDIATDVLIVGAGPVGLSLAVELGRRGIRCLLVEQHDGVGYNPRAKLTNTRSREHLRRWGIAENLRAASPIPADAPARVIFATRFNGYKLAVFENALNCSSEPDEQYSESAQWVPQYTLEEVLRAHAETFPNVTVRFNCRLDAAEQSAGGVTARIADTVSGELETVRSAYLVGSDGVRSTVRELLGLRMEGQFGLAKFLNIIFTAPDLAAAHNLGFALQYWFVNDQIPVVLAPMDDGSAGKYFMGVPLVPGFPDAAQLDPREMLRRGTGLDLPIEVELNDPWTSHSIIAPRYRTGRIFLAGDAAHAHPPFGGYGMNMGIGDAVDLGWKLAATLQGWGGAALLDSYESERRPYHQLVLAEAVANQAVLGSHLVREGIEEPGPRGDAIRAEVGRAILASKRREFDTLGVVLGYRYDGSPIVESDGTPAPPENYAEYRPSARPGCLAPHTWLADGSSLYDHFGIGYTLLVTSGARTADAGRFAAEAAELGVPLVVLAPGEPRVAELYGARYALIRPDQHVAWRGDDLPLNPAGLLDRITGRVPRGESITIGA